MRLADKIALITGAGSGVGRVSALRFVEEGARVVCADIDEHAAQATAQRATAAGGAAIAVTADVSKEADVVAAIDTAVNHFGRLDIVFNNVGIPTPRLGMNFEDHTAEEFNSLFAVNAGGVFYGCKHSVIRFKTQGTGGVILNTGSVAGLVGWGGAVYGATKGAVHQLTKALAVEAAPHGIRVNAICPAAMPHTGFMAAGGMPLAGELLENVVDHISSTHPLGKVISPEDCAEAAVFLCSDESSNITGILVPIDGGFVAR
jgi:NAD(P)-dependent dehydrogenase (short-subunit alcohol dehydrogenase family)